MDTVLRKLGEGSPTSSESLSLRQPKALLGWKIAAAGLVILVAFLSYRYTDLEQRYDDIRIEKRDTLESIHTSIVRHSVSVAFRRYLTTCFITEDVQPGTLPSTLKFRARMTLEGKLTNVQLDGVEDERVRFCVMATMLKVQILHHDFWIDGMFPLRFMETLGDELCKIYVGAPLSILAWVRLDVAQGGEIRRS